MCSLRIVGFMMFCFVAAGENRVQLGDIFGKEAVSESGGTGVKMEHLLESKRVWECTMLTSLMASSWMPVMC